MSDGRPAWSASDTERIIGVLLRAGVILAGSVVVMGGAVYLSRHGAEHPDYRVFRGEPSDYCTVTGIMREVLDFRGRGIIQLGLLILIATPVVRVIFSVIAFALERDRLYVGVALTVLAILVFSLAGGHF